MKLDSIKAVLELIDGTDVTELEYEHEGLRIAIRRGRPAPAAPTYAAGPAYAPPAAAPVVGPRGSTVTSPFVGTIYRAGAPDAAPFTEIGQHVTKGQTLCIVEAMKLMNEIECEVSGTVRQILVTNGQPVEYGQILFLIDPD